MIHPIDATNYSKATKWCAPSAVAALTGAPLVTTTELLTRISGCSYEDLEACWSEEAILALSELGFKCVPIDVVTRFSDTTHGPTLKRFWRERQGLERVMPLLIEVGGHVLTTIYDMACDNWTMKPVPINKFPKPNRLVKAAWIVMRTQ